MAEFKLGRIRFIWKGDWALSTVYYKDDIVRNGGNTYVCIAGHTAPALFTTSESTYWNKITDGQDWKGDWGINTYYKVNDIVKYGGYLYVANEAHTSDANITLGLENQQSKWDLFAEGFDYKAAWAPVTRYKINDIAKYNGTVYICTLEHTSGADNAAGIEPNNGSILTVDSVGAADVSRTPGTYNNLSAGGGFGKAGKVNVVVAVGGGATVTVSDAGTQYLVGDTLSIIDSQLGGGGGAILTFNVATTLDNWDIFSTGMEWQGDWGIDTRYRRNDIVKFGGTLYVANRGHTSAASEALGLEANQSDWDYLNNGLEYKTDWVGSTRYKINDVVKYGGGIWICTTYHTSQSTFAADENSWAQFVEGLEFEDSWSVSATYQPGDFVTYGGYSYVAKTNNTGNAVPNGNTTDWELFTTGFNFLGDYATATAAVAGATVATTALVLDTNSGTIVQGMVVTGTSIVGTVTVTTVTDQNNLVLSSAQSLTNDVVLSFNTAYKVGDAIRLGGYSYLCTADHSAQRPPNTDYWQRLNQGFAWKNTWTDATLYDAGDTVYHGVNSYICILAHTSDEVTLTNRPDQDTGGVNWNLMNAGAESGNLTTNGDIVYYSGSGGTRLPVGEIGQGLKVNNVGNAPEWAFFGAINNVFYVSTINGIDAPAPAYGITLDRPFKTIRYATEQVQAGAIRGNAKSLLQRNRSFIQDEVIEYIKATYPALSYVEATCRRDVGQVLDAAIWDITHGGNERSVKAAKSYFATDGTTYLADNATETADGLAYIKVVADAVLSNVAPGTVRGSLNQVVDATKNEEADAQAALDASINIVTAAITAGDTTGVPAESKPQHSIFVKTGEFEEVLPIIVPENTAVVGDELRSTRVKPASALVAASDVAYSLDALSRLTAIMSNIVTNGSVTKTTGNALTQVTTAPAGSVTAGADAANLVQQIYDYIDYRISGVSGDSTVPASSGVNIPNATTDYTYAVEAIEANRLFLVAEVVAYIADTYPSYTYDEAACSRDVNAYLNAIQHDLVYTGNYKSLLAARYYANAVQGSLTEDMFYMRNGTGLRNCTITGLAGTLGSANAYGTKRPTAGAFVSLDPGWGPTHTDAWILNKSPYIQNVTTFGTGCVGCKIDGDLHAGGNDSIVANDFTQIISDGIGVWCTNLGRTELVSVFSYYGHIGYLAENGGKIRATNGNSSYGAFGTVAEGIDSTETPLGGNVDNFALQAIVSSILTNGDDILTLEYLNAGVNYTAGGTTISAIGEGYGAAINAVQTTDGAVFEVRLTETVEEPSNFGGTGYLDAQNVAQGGTATQITISNTDTRVNAAYIGMAIFITAGVGAGQYGYIDTYNSGTKIATIKKCSDDSAGWDHVIGTAIVSLLNETTTYSIEPRLSFTAPSSSLYADTTACRAVVADGKIARITIWNPGSGYSSAPTMTITDPNNTVEVPFTIRFGNGVLTQPTWTDRGTGMATASATVVGDGYADMFQPGSLVNVSDIATMPQAGSNITFASIPGKYFKLVTIRNVFGSGPYTAQFQVSPDISISDAVADDVAFETRIRYSQVRLTGHDFLDIGTGNFADTNYPNTPVNPIDPTKETVVGGGGRVFYTTTDQDGNFRVGGLFNVEQSTGVATLNADAFNITGLNELQLGAVSLGGTGAVITEFSTDGTFTANSDNIVPTQKAIKTYIASQIGGGAGELNVNSLTAGVVKVSGQEITTTNLSQINILQKVNFTGGITGSPVAINYFLSS
jgi:hypothetical protein|tara:strand:+ start:4615 stop:9813 length:5199 start_codon:yes stop_codon:yes gene_type:complete